MIDPTFDESTGAAPADDALAVFEASHLSDVRRSVKARVWRRRSAIGAPVLLIAGASFLLVNPLVNAPAPETDIGIDVAAAPEVTEGDVSLDGPSDSTDGSNASAAGAISTEITLQGLNIDPEDLSVVTNQEPERELTIEPTPTATPEPRPVVGNAGEAEAAEDAEAVDDAESTELSATPSADDEPVLSSPEEASDELSPDGDTQEPTAELPSASTVDTSVDSDAGVAPSADDPTADAAVALEPTPSGVVVPDGSIVAEVIPPTMTDAADDASAAAVTGSPEDGSAPGQSDTADASAAAGAEPVLPADPTIDIVPEGEPGAVESDGSLGAAAPAADAVSGEAGTNVPEVSAAPDTDSALPADSATTEDAAGRSEEVVVAADGDETAADPAVADAPAADEVPADTATGTEAPADESSADSTDAAPVEAATADDTATDADAVEVVPDDPVAGPNQPANVQFVAKSFNGLTVELVLLVTDPDGWTAGACGTSMVWGDGSATGSPCAIDCVRSPADGSQPPGVAQELTFVHTFAGFDDPTLVTPQFSIFTGLECYGDVVSRKLQPSLIVSADSVTLAG